VLLLFDIDGTLLMRAAAEHAQAMHETTSDIWGVDTSGVKVPTGGRTDPEIVRTLLAGAGVDDARIDERIGELVPTLVAHYERLKPDDLSGFLAPGAVDALDELSADEERRLSLVTGNVQEIGRRKLELAGIGHHFAEGQGGFACDSAHRPDLPPIARERAAVWNGGDPWPRERTVVIGDTTRDIACARADGVRVICVPTGPQTADELADADEVIESLHELPGALRRLG
jgi:phosphoglycolate phosphatase